jgi:hypothetical protein
MKKPRKPTNDEKAMARVLDRLNAGRVLTVHAANGYYTAGPYRPAVGPQGFAVYGYGGLVREPNAPAREYTGKDDSTRAAWAVVSSCGSTRARDAAIVAGNKG